MPRTHFAVDQHSFFTFLPLFFYPDNTEERMLFTLEENQHMLLPGVPTDRALMYTLPLHHESTSSLVSISVEQ